MGIDRRYFIKQSLFFGSGSVVACSMAKAQSLAFLTQKSLPQLLDQAGGPNQLKVFNPFIDISTKSSTFESGLNDFDGDNPDFPHEIMWAKKTYLSKLKIAEILIEKETVIVGGGMAGLCSAYYLQNQNVLLLEQSPQVGGVSKGHRNNNDQLTSIGAAYVTIPDAGSEIENLFKALNLEAHFKKENASPIILNSIKNDFFKNVLSENDQKIFNLIENELKDIFENRFPEIPLSSDNENKSYTLKLDEISFFDWLNNICDNKIPTLIYEYYEMYAWSSFNGTIKEISAAQFLNFISAETIGIITLPGGNARICNEIYENIKSKVQIECSSFVADITKTASGYILKFVKDGILFQVKTKNIIFAAPKFLVDKVFDASVIDSDFIKTCEQIIYRSYIVANITLNTPIDLPAYDYFILNNEIPTSPTALKPPDRGFADIVNAEFDSKNRQTQHLTIYKPQPYQGARQLLFSPMAFDKIKKSILSELDLRGISSKNVSEIRLTRWGHAMPLAIKGGLQNYFSDQFKKYEDQNLFFIGQDVALNPAFETAHQTAYDAAMKINSRL